MKKPEYNKLEGMLFKMYDGNYGDTKLNYSAYIRLKT